MVFDSEWITIKGTITEDNRDYCTIAIRGSDRLYCVVDGSSQSEQSGALADDFVKALADRFVAQPEINSKQDIISVLGELSEHFKTLYPAGRLSFLILLYHGGSKITAIHAGDCRLGRCGADRKITWLTRVHTLANAVGEIEEIELCKSDDRHILTRGFRPGRQCESEVRCFSLMSDECLVVGTDGFWAGLDEVQRAGFVEKGFEPSNPDRDDVSCLILKRPSSSCAANKAKEDVENLYVVTD